MALAFCVGQGGGKQQRRHSDWNAQQKGERRRQAGASLSAGDPAQRRGWPDQGAAHDGDQWHADCFSGQQGMSFQPFPAPRHARAILILRPVETHELSCRLQSRGSDTAA